MDNVSTLHRPVAQPFSTKWCEAFRVSDGRTYAIRADKPLCSIEEAKTYALTQRLFVRGDTLLVRESDQLSGASQLHVFAIKQKAPRWVHPAGEMIPRRVEDRYADPVCVIDEVVLFEGMAEPRPAA